MIGASSAARVRMTSARASRVTRHPFESRASKASARSPPGATTPAESPAGPCTAGDRTSTASLAWIPRSTGPLVRSWSRWLNARRPSLPTAFIRARQPRAVGRSVGVLETGATNAEHAEALRAGAEHAQGPLKSIERPRQRGVLSARRAARPAFSAFVVGRGAG